MKLFFWVIPWRLNVIYRRFGTLCLFHPFRQVGVKRLNLRIVGVSIGRRFGSKIVRADWKEGDGVRVGPVTRQVVKGVTTYMETAACMCVVTPCTTCIVTGHTLTPSPSFQSAQTIFEPNVLPMDTPTILKFSRFTPTCL